MFDLSRFLLLANDRCNLRCKLCSESIPNHKPEPDMTVEQARKILKSFFETVDHIGKMHISGGGEPFLHARLPELIEECMVYRKQFDEFIIFTKSTITPNQELLDTLGKYSDVITVRMSCYGLYPEKERNLQQLFEANHVKYHMIKYSGEDQDYGGWVDYGDYVKYNRSEDELKRMFAECATKRDLNGNWRSRDGELHICTRSQRGMQLGLVPRVEKDYVDLLDESLSVEQKQEKIKAILTADYITACDYCSGDYGTRDKRKRYPAAEQIEK